MLRSGRGRWPRRSRADRGSVLMLLPACVLIVLVLASIAVDMSLVHLRQRQGFDVAAAAANDAATAAADRRLLRSGQFSLDSALAEQVVVDAVAASDLAPHVVGRAAVVVDGATVEVSVTVAAEHLFTGVMPGAPDRSLVTATASATAREP
jgi:uncharacterized membrane protein